MPAPAQIIPKVSIIIPCFNQGKYLGKTIESALAQTLRDIEIIVVDDGSTDPETQKFLDKYSHEKVRILRQKNTGAAEARNTGIKAACAPYILPLDADDLIAPRYAEKATQILDSDPAVGIVYCRAAYFGAQTGKWKMNVYPFDKILEKNFIFCSALYRRTDWLAAGGYNANMIHGYEDWDFWVSLYACGVRKIHRLDDTFFYYRRHKKISRNDGVLASPDHLRRMHLQIVKNHLDLYLEHPEALVNILRIFLPEASPEKNLKAKKSLRSFLTSLLGKA